MKQKRFYLGVPILGTIFCLWYIKAATCNVVYTDYIRLVNVYLPDVWNPEKFFVPDILTRIPIHYLGRGINATFFGFSTTFDMILGVLGLGLSGTVLGIYCHKKRVSGIWYLILMLTLFNLNKWEMLTNGSGWAHFLAFAGFYYHYLVFDRMLAGREKSHDRIRLFLLPFVITLGIAGPYCAVYTVTMLIFYIFALIMNRKRAPGRKGLTGMWLTALVCVLIPFFLYLWSNSYAVEDHADTYSISIMELFQTAPSFFPRFLLKALASSVVGGETIGQWITDGIVTDNQVYLLGGIVASGYLLALFLLFRYRLYEQTVLPGMLLLSGIGNHGIVLISRYIFLNENYAMSSRYALQYQAGTLGIILIFALLWKRIKSSILKAAGMLLTVVFITGLLYTTRVEIKKAPNRAENMEKMAVAAQQFESISDEDLPKIFQYRQSRPDSGEKIRAALTILKDNHWNVFR